MRGEGGDRAQATTSPPSAPLLPGEHDKGELRVLGTHHYMGHTTKPLKGSFGEKKKNTHKAISAWVIPVISFLLELLKQ